MQKRNLIIEQLIEQNQLLIEENQQLRKKKIKRKRGAQKGHKNNSRQAFKDEQIDDTFEYEYMMPRG